MNSLIDKNRIPQHVAIIMDGNGRWANARGQARLVGHNAGMEALREIVRHSQELGVKYLTVYAFSTENWKRPEDEISGLFKLLVKYFDSEIDELHSNHVKIQALGDYSRLPKDSKKAIDDALTLTKNNDGLNFSIAINYGGRDEITKAVKKIVEKGIKPEDITEELISANLYTYNLPDPEVIIRTSGEVRLSNFLIWQSAYSEIVVTPVLWPDFNKEEYDKCIIEYQNRNRRFGGIK
ncbi:MAG: isoprenyl transferase [Bacillota bacterium]|nr:isoprenyl transferase [Bacillota bacterium]